MRRILSILTTLLLSLTVMAQRYSVTVTPVLLPPYTLNLSELTAQGSAKMMTTITVNDLTARNLPVRLHFKLESAGITIENIPTSAVAPMFLNGGETQILTGADMAQYLRLDNLEFRGYSKESYRQTGQLPGGLWKVTVEVRHFHTGRSLSNRGTATVWVSIYDPPVLTAPRNGTEAPDNPSLPLVFSWQASKHTGGTVAVQYKLELWEMRMEGVPAQTVAASMTPIFETTTQVTSYTAIPTGMNLEPGIRYCWRVTVSDPSNQAQINKNGQSEVREFTYLHTCPPVDEVTATVRNTQADFSWTPSPYHTHFRVEMLQEGGSSDVSDCYDSKFRLYDFPQGTTWRVRVRGECKGDLVADWSPWTDFSIDPPGTPPTNDECPDCGCDDGPAKRNIENYELKELQPGDTIVNRTGRTRFIVLSANATGEDVYSGQFYLWLELWRTKVRCDYTDLKVNTDGVILDGSWRSVHNDGLMVNPATVAENIQNIRNGIANATFDNSISDTIKLGYAVQTIYKDENGRYIAILEDGSEHDLTQDLSTANKTMVEDSQGNKMVVTGDQQLMSAEQYHNTGKNNTLIKSDNERKDKQIAASGDVVFMPSSAQTYGFDAYDASTNNHPEIYPPLEGGSYRPAYKSVAQWQQDKVAADPMQGVTFRNQMGVPYATTSGDIILRGEPQPGETPVYAHVAETDSTTKVVGKLNLLTFEPREINVCLVPVNGATPPNAQTLEKELNKIFKPAVASVKLSTHSGITIDYADGSGFVHGGSGPLTVYSNDEKAAINALTDANDDTYYLFLVKNVTKLDADGNRTIVSGYMPVGYQHGFIFEQFDVARTIAHELSHGAFALHHTFSANTESFRADEGTTTNLMDYTEHGTTLNHKQWTWMHENHGKGLFGFLADESEGEWTTDGHYYLFTYLGMLMGMKYKQAEELGRYAEKPDSYVISEEDISNGYVVIEGKRITLSESQKQAGNMLENTTWTIGGLQQLYHALTGGYHGVELAATAYAIFHKDDLGFTNDYTQYLLHRFGDVYAHFDIENDAKGLDDDVSLSEYISAFDTFIKNEVTLVDEGNMIIEKEGKIYSPFDSIETKKKIVKSVLAASSCIVRANPLYYGGEDISEAVNSLFLSNNELQRKILQYLPNAAQNSYRMYGTENICNTFTFGHTFDGGKPDEIIRRPKLFMLYVKHTLELMKLAKLVAEDKDTANAMESVRSIVNWGVKQDDKSARLDGIFALQIALLNGDKTFKIPIKWLSVNLNLAGLLYYDVLKKSMFGTVRNSFNNDANTQRLILEDYSKSQNIEIRFENKDTYWLGTINR